MSALLLRRLRIWVAFLSVVTVIIMAAFYGYLAHLYSEANQEFRLGWQDWVSIVGSVIFFFSYIYALRGKPRVHRYARAFLLFVVCVLVLYVNLKSIAQEVKFASLQYPYKAFYCSSDEPTCFLFWTYDFLTVITGFFILFELALTLKVGPLEPGSQQLYGRHGYETGANVVVVSPEQPPHGGYVPQPLYYPQQNQYAYPQMAGVSGAATMPAHKVEEPSPMVQQQQPYYGYQQPSGYQQPQVS
ncbi:hypothetical protein BGZ99_004293 [Dissophora globulifera]|uniref:Uncharacterized protein n=1 Tax=Dissophora globulifera TaxID=979702 RepID=A0A9P6UV78_9FUNG|nr:hypothetical protein BGZ99_004293 [Dissophora globulifera]